MGRITETAWRFLPHTSLSVEAFINTLDYLLLKYGVTRMEADLFDLEVEDRTSILIDFSLVLYFNSKARD
jgi:hypothetical protein